MNRVFIPYWIYPWNWIMRRIKSDRKRMEGSNGKWKEGRYFAPIHSACHVWNFKCFLSSTWKAFFHLIWPFHPFSIGFDSLSISIPRMIPIGKECKVQNSFKYRLELIFSFGVPHLHLYIYTHIYIDGDAGRRTRKRALVNINN